MCPVDTRGDLTAYYHRGTEVSTSAAYYGYSNCINNATQWEQLDAANAANGYHSDLAGDETRWTISLTCVVGSIIVLAFAGFLLFMMLSDATGAGGGSVSLYGMVLALLLVLLFFAQQLAVVLLTSEYRRADAKAWSSVFFASCSTHVRPAVGYWLSFGGALFSGMVLLLVGVAAVWHTYRSPSLPLSTSAPSRRRREGYKELPGDVSGFNDEYGRF
jgi:hypothetical protein